MNNVQLAQAQAAGQRIGGARFRVVADISCDIEVSSYFLTVVIAKVIQGGLEFVTRAATIDEPVFTSRPSGHPQDLPGIRVMSVDILPSELPLDSSRHFSDKLLPYLRSLIRSEQGRALTPEDTGNLETLQRGTISQDGKLQEPHSWLATRVGCSTNSSSSVPLLATHSQPSLTKAVGMSMSKKRRVLILGSGMVARPAIDHVATRKDIELIVGRCLLRFPSARVPKLRISE